MRNFLTVIYELLLTDGLADGLTKGSPHLNHLFLDSKLKSRSINYLLMVLYLICMISLRIMLPHCISNKHRLFLHKTSQSKRIEMLQRVQYFHDSLSNTSFSSHNYLDTCPSIMLCHVDSLLLKDFTSRAINLSTSLNIVVLYDLIIQGDSN